MKFKTGERYKVNNKRTHDYGIIVEIIKINGRWVTCKRENGTSFAFNIESPYAENLIKIESEKPETIVIYRKGNETIALDKRTGKKAVAKCCPEDTYNFDTGAELAFKRLMDLPKYKEVHRRAKAGEYVKIINPYRVPKNNDGTPCYKNGDIVKMLDYTDIFGRARFRDGADTSGRQYILLDSEYVVLEGYEPEQPKTDGDEIKVGDKVKVIDTGKLCTTNIEWFKRNNVNPELLGRYAYNDDLGFYKGIYSLNEVFTVEYVAEGKALISKIDRTCYLLVIKGLKKC
jgi:hypothetical protein